MPRLRLYSALVVFVLICAAYAQGARLSRLANGIPVAIMEKSGSGSLSVQLLVRIGDLDAQSRAEVENLAGAIFGETENMSLLQMRRLAWLVGGSVEAECSGDVFRIGVTTQKGYLQPAVALLSNVVRKPVFTQEALDASVRGYQLRRQQAIPPEREIQALLSPINIDKLTQNRAERLHRSIFRPERMAIGIAGDVNAEAATKFINDSLGAWEPQPTDLERKKAVVLASPLRSPNFPMATFELRGPSVQSDEFVPWIVFATLLGDGKASALGVAARQNGNAYLSGVAYIFRDNSCSAMFYASGFNSDAIKKTLQDAALSAKSLARAKAFLIGQYQVGTRRFESLQPFAQGHQRPEERAFWAAWWSLHGGIELDERFPRLVEAVTLPKVAAAAAKWLPRTP